MHLPIPNLQPERSPEPPAMVHVVSREDVLWNRWVFKAPPLEVTPPKVDAKAIAEEFRRSARGTR
jgi:hypothetical protein